MKKVLIINRGIFPTKRELIDDYDIDIISLYRNIPSILRLFRVIHFKLKLPFLKIWEIKNIDKIFKNYDIIILHDSSSYFHLQRFINHIEKFADNNTKLIFYYWNNVIENIKPLKFSDRWDKVSFDFNDSQKFNLRYVGGYYIPQKNDQENEISSDVFFIGINKGRFPTLISLEKKLRNAGIKPLFILVSKIKSFFSSKYSQPYNYLDVIKFIHGTKCILDITKTNQIGLSLRTYEAIFYNKKFITFNKTIKKYDFYNSNNILIMSDDIQINRIMDFLSVPLVPYNAELLKRYSFDAWIERVDKGETLRDVIE
jgi:hypothetical protein